MDYKSEAFDEMCKKYKKSTITIEEAAVEAGVSVADIKSVIETGELEVKKIGTKEVISIISFLKFLSGESIQDTVDNTSNKAVTSLTQENIEIVEDDTDMKGTVTHIKASGLWIYQLDLGKTSDAKRIRKTKSFKTEAEARAALAIELTLINGIEGTNSHKSTKEITLKELIEAYLKLENRSATSRSLDNYYTVGRKIVEEYGDCKLSNLKPENLITLFNKIKKTCSDSIITKVYLLLKMVMEYAVASKLLALNPMASVKKPKSEKMKSEEYKAFTTQELTEIMTAARGNVEMYPILLLLQNTGMRPGELRALKLENIDFQKKTVSIKKAATFKTHREGLDSKPYKTEYIGPTKSSYSVRTLSLPNVVVEALKKWCEYINTTDKYKKAVNSDFLFPNVEGDFIKDDHLRKRFRKFLKDAGLSEKGYHLYRFRHTMCTNLVLKNTPIPVIQRIMGDNTTDVILKIYTSINSSDVTAATTVVQQYFDSINNPVHVV